MDDKEVRDRVARIDTLLERLDSLADPAARAMARDTVQLLLEVYGEGLARVMRHVERAGDDGLPATLAGDELVAHLLLLHGLHPVALDARVGEALESVRPYLESQGAEARLIALEGDVARLRVEASGNNQLSSTKPLEVEIERALRRAAPELDRVQFEAAAPATFIPLATLTRHAKGRAEDHASQRHDG